MALIKCPECGKEISDLSDKCPNCGFPIGLNSTTTTPNNSETQTNSDPYNNPYQTGAQQIKEYTPNQKNSALGVLALVFSILGCTFIIGIILAIIDLLKKDGRKKTCSIIALVISIAWFVLAMAVGGNDSSTNKTSSSVEKTVSTEIKEESAKELEVIEKAEVKEEPKAEEIKEEPATEEQSKYYVGDTWQNKYLKVIYTKCYEFTDYNQYNAPASGNKIICAEFEFENIGSSDETVMYTDFHGYADGYEVSQSYSPEGTGLDFSVKMSAGRKGTGIVAFEVPENATEIEIEFSPNFWTSENVVFVYQ